MTYYTSMVYALKWLEKIAKVRRKYISTKKLSPVAKNVCTETNNK